MGVVHWVQHVASQLLQGSQHLPLRLGRVAQRRHVLAVAVREPAWQRRQEKGAGGCRVITRGVGDTPKHGYESPLSPGGGHRGQGVQLSIAEEHATPRLGCRERACQKREDEHHRHEQTRTTVRHAGRHHARRHRACAACFQLLL